MDKLREDKLDLYRRKEEIVKNVEENEAMEAAMRLKTQSHKTHIGPANDLLRYLYILEQQYQSDSSEIRARTREHVLEYINQYRQTDDINEEEEESDDSSPATPDIPQIFTAVPPPSQRPPPIIPLVQQPPPPIVSLSQPPLPPIVSLSQPPPPPIISLSQPPPSSIISQPPTVAPLVSSNNINPVTLVNYQKLQNEANEYEKRYGMVDGRLKNQFQSRIKVLMNKIREETFNTLTTELFEFLNGHQQQVSGQIIRVSNEEERLLCLSITATLILSQLLGGDLNDIKTNIFLPLVGKLSESQENKEFKIIFLDRLHKRCPYTVPFYPVRQANMDDDQYLLEIGYIQKQDGDHRRLETETEFLNRMNGLIRLFCKLLVRRGPPFENDLSFAWRWFADVLNLPARPNITSILIRVFLDEACAAMVQEYPTQFPKILQTIREKYLPRLEKETSDDQITRLRLTLDTFGK